MSIKKFIIWTGNSCLKALQNIGTTVQHRCNRKKLYRHRSLGSLSLKRVSVSTVVTDLDFEPQACQQPHNVEISDNRWNESVERRNAALDGE